MSVNVRHYNLDKISTELKTLAESNGLNGPCFIGQGLSKAVGSDCYGFYITTKNEIESASKRKVIWGISSAYQVMRGYWYEGDMDCSLDWNNYKVCHWITKYGKSWYFCDANGKRFNGQKCRFGWNGAYGYQDPSF